MVTHTWSLFNILHKSPVGKFIWKPDIRFCSMTGLYLIFSTTIYKYSTFPIRMDWRDYEFIIDNPLGNYDLCIPFFPRISLSLRNVIWLVVKQLDGTNQNALKRLMNNSSLRGIIYQLTHQWRDGKHHRAWSVVA